MKLKVLLFILCSPCLINMVNAQLVGSRIRLETFYPNFDTQTSTQPIRTVTETAVEFPDVGQFDAGVSPGDVRLVNVDIDLVDNAITISFSGNSGSFAPASVNTYVFTDVDDTIPSFTSVSIDDSVTTLGIQPGRVSFNENQIFINVSGLSFSSTTFAKFDIETAAQPEISIARLSGGELSIAFTGVFESSPNLEPGSWQPIVPSPTSPYVIKPTTGSIFFRSREAD